MSTAPIEPAYVLPDVGEPLVTYEGRASLPDGSEVKLRIRSPLIHSADMRWTATGEYDWDLNIQEATLLDGPHADMIVELRVQEHHWRWFGFGG